MGVLTVKGEKTEAASEALQTPAESFMPGAQKGEIWEAKGPERGNRLLTLLEEILQRPTPEAYRVLVEGCPLVLPLIQGAVLESPEISGQSEGRSVSQRLSGQNQPEFERWAVSVLVLQWLRDGGVESWRAFKECQPRERAITFEAFSLLSEAIREASGDEDSLQAALIGITASSAAKVGLQAWDAMQPWMPDNAESKAALEAIWKVWRQNSPDHDQALTPIYAAYPEILPGVPGLAELGRRALEESNRAGFSFPQFVQLENVPASLTVLLTVSPEAKSFTVLHGICDIGGSLGIKARNGSLTLTENTARSALAARQSLGAGSEIEIYDSYLAFRAAQYGLDPSNPVGRALTRVAAMARLEDDRSGTAREQARHLEEVFAALPREKQDVLVRELNESGLAGVPAIVPYHGPALFNRLLARHRGEPDGFERGFDIGLRSLEEVFRRARSQAPESGSGAIYCYMHQVAELAGKPGSLGGRILAVKACGKHLQVVPREDPTDLAAAKGESPIVSVPPRALEGAHPVLASLATAVRSVERGIGAELNRALAARLQIGGSGAQPEILALRDGFRGIHARCQTLSHRLTQLALFGSSEIPALDLLDRSGIAAELPDTAQRVRAHLAQDPRKLGGVAALEHGLEGLRLRVERFWHAVPPRLRASERPERLFRLSLASLDALSADLAGLAVAASEARSTEERLAAGPRELGRVVLEERPSHRVCEELRSLLAPYRFRPGDPRIHDRGISITDQSLAKFEDLLSKGGRLLTVRGQDERVLGYALWFEPADAGKRDASIAEKYRTYGATAYFHFIAVGSKDSAVPVYPLALESVALQLPCADVACGRVQEDNFRAFVVHGRHNLQLYVPDVQDGRSDIGEDPFALFQGRDRTKSIGIVLPLSPAWREEFRLTGLTWREAYEQASGVVERRFPGLSSSKGQALSEAWNAKRERKEYLDAQIGLHDLLPLDDTALRGRLPGVWASRSGRALFGDMIAAVVPADRIGKVREMFAPDRHSGYDEFYFDARAVRDVVRSALKPLHALHRESAEIGAWQAQVRRGLEEHYGHAKAAAILAAFEDELPLWKALDLI